MRQNKALHIFSLLTALSTLFLLFVGGMVTSKSAGLSVPDWPLSYGMFFPPMVGNIFYEHSHRMTAGFVGILTIILCGWLWAREPRRWICWVGTAALFAVICQAILGGITVLFLLPTFVSVGHAALAEIFFCLTVSLALFTSKEWTEEPPLALQNKGNAGFARITVVSVVLVYLQILLGAWMRHKGAGLAVPDFPTSFGHFLPPHWNFEIALHTAHRLFGFLVAIWIIAQGIRASQLYLGQTRLIRPAIGLEALVLAQIALGGATVWTQKAPIIATTHLALGAVILAGAVILMLRARRHLEMSC